MKKQFFLFRRRGIAAGDFYFCGNIYERAATDTITYSGAFLTFAECLEEASNEYARNAMHAEEYGDPYDI